MNKTVLAITGVGVATIGSIIFSLLVRDEKEAMSEKGIKEWANEKALLTRTEDHTKLFEEYNKAERDFKADKDGIEKSINEQLNKWKKETRVDEKITRLENNCKRDLEEYRKSISYDEKIKNAYKEKDNILRMWEEEYGYSDRKHEIEEGFKEAKSDYERGRKALELISNENVKDVSQKILKEEYKKRCDKLNESKADLKSRHEVAELKAQKHADDIINPLKEKYRVKKVEIEKVYSGDIEDLKQSIAYKKEKISDFEYANRSDVSINIENEYINKKRAVEDVKSMENHIAEGYILDADRHRSEILYYNLKKKGWGKWSLYLFEGLMPIGIGLGLIYMGAKSVKWGLFNIKAIYCLSNES